MNSGLAAALHPESSSPQQAPKVSAPAREDCDTCEPPAQTSTSAPLTPRGAGDASIRPVSSSTAPQQVAVPAAALTPVPTSSDPALDPSTFVPPLRAGALPGPSLVIEFCDRCRWQHRATWIQTELFLTFPSNNDPQAPASKASGGGAIQSITLIPRTAPETGGRFRVWLYGSPGQEEAISLLWDRKIKGGFPELKELKQLVRNQIAPNLSLGHSDKKH